MQLLKEVQKFELQMTPGGVDKCIMSTAVKELHNEAVKCGVLTNIDKDFQNFVYDVNEEIRICVSSETKRKDAGGVLRMPLLLKETQRFELKMELKRKGERIMSTVMKEFHDEEFTFCVRKNIDKGFQNLVYDVKEEIGICVSLDTKCIKKGDVRGKRLLQTGDQDRHFVRHGNPEHISKFTHFMPTIDDLYLVYSCEGSLHALSLQTGKVLTSVSGCNLIYLRKERQFGYLFRSDTEERAILLTSLFNPFKFLALSPVNSSNVGKSIGAIFCSSNTVLSVSSDSKITSWETTANKEGIAFICESLLTEPGVQSLPVKNCLLSSDGRLIAIHQKTKVDLYSFEDNAEEKKFVHTVYESKCEFTVACFVFSVDSTLLLFCIQDSRRYPRLYVWDVHQKVMAASLKSPGLLTIECCCFSWDKRLVILCGDYDRGIRWWHLSKAWSREALPLCQVRPMHCLVRQSASGSLHR